MTSKKLTKVAVELVGVDFVTEAIKRVEKEKENGVRLLLKDVVDALGKDENLFQLKKIVHVEMSNDNVVVLKENGNDAFKKKKYVEAVAAFTKGLLQLTVKTPQDANLQSILFTNRCAAWHALEHWENAFVDASLAIASYPAYAKAWFRRAKIIEGALNVNSTLASTLCEKIATNDMPEVIAQKDLAMAKLLVEEGTKAIPQAMDRAISCCLPTPSISPYKIAPYHTNIHVETSPHAGRLLRASKRIEAGDLLLQEEPVAWVNLCPLRQCDVCLQPCMNAIPCDYCTHIAFCSVYCKQKCEFHNCSLSFDAPTNLLLNLAQQMTLPMTSKNAFRPWTTADLIALKPLFHQAGQCIPPNLDLGSLATFVKNNFGLILLGNTVDGWVHYCPQSNGLLQACFHYNSDTDANSNQIQSWVCDIPTYQHQNLNQVVVTSSSISIARELARDTQTWLQISPMQFIYRGYIHKWVDHLQTDLEQRTPQEIVHRILFVAALAILQEQHVNPCLVANQLFNLESRIGINQLAITSCKVDDANFVGQERIGSGLYPAMAMCNHSCNPNASVQYDLKTLRLVATRPIEAGEEICISYGPHKAKMDTKMRQQILYKQYGFICTCSSCTDDVHDDDFEAFLAQSKQEEAKIVEQVESMKNPPFAKLLKETRTLLASRQRELPSSHVAIAQAHDILARIYMINGDFSSAGDQVAHAIAILQANYERLDAELGHEYLKAAQLYFNAHQHKQTKTFLSLALESLTLHLPSTDAIFDEIRMMQDYLTY